MITANESSSGRDATIDALRELGFTDLESRIYLHLLRSGPETGYAAAKAIGKPVANTYKAVESLERKGAVEVEDGEPRVVRASAPSEVIGRLRRGFEQRASQAERALDRLDEPEGDERVYQLRSAAQVLERARRMIAGAERAVVIDAFPQIAATLASELITAAARGVSVAALVYEPIELPGCSVIVHAEGELVTRLIEAQHLLLCSDAKRAVLGLVEPAIAKGSGIGPVGDRSHPEPRPVGDRFHPGLDWPETGGVRQAIYTASPFIAWHLHDNFHHQLFTYAVRDALRDDEATREKLRAVYRERLAGVAPISTPGWRALLERHGSPDALNLTDDLLAKGRFGTTGASRAHDGGAP